MPRSIPRILDMKNLGCERQGWLGDPCARLFRRTFSKPHAPRLPISDASDREPLTPPCALRKVRHSAAIGTLLWDTSVTNGTHRSGLSRREFIDLAGSFRNFAGKFRIPPEAFRVPLGAFQTRREVEITAWSPQTSAGTFSTSPGNFSFSAGSLQISPGRLSRSAGTS